MNKTAWSIFSLLLSSWVIAADPATQPATLPFKQSAESPGISDEKMLELAMLAVIQEAPKAQVAAVRSKNIHLGERQMASPLPDYGFFCAMLGPGMAAPKRRFIAVSRSGQIISPIDATKFGELVAAADRGKWKEQDFLNAATLYVHLTTVANEDGWKLLGTPEDFLAIKMNMPTMGPAVPKRLEAAGQIVAAKVDQKDGQATVSFYAWHLIGGALRHWEIKIGPKVEATKQELGQFGGGGYD